MTLSAEGMVIELGVRIVCKGDRNMFSKDALIVSVDSFFSEMSPFEDY